MKPQDETMKGKLTELPRAEEYAAQICAQIGKSVESIIGVGQLLRKAKKTLRHGQWERLFNEALIPLGLASAERFMKIAKHKLLSKSANWPILPPAWRTLYDLTKVPDEVLQNALADGRIRPDMKGRDVKALLPAVVPDEEGFHWMLAISDLRKRIERVVTPWPEEARALVPKALRDLADILEVELGNAQRREGLKTTSPRDGGVVENRQTVPERRGVEAHGISGLCQTEGCVGAGVGG